PPRSSPCARAWTSPPVSGWPATCAGCCPRARPTRTPAWTVSLLELTVDAPSHWQVLGPLVWAELERTHVMVRTGRASGLQQRRLRLDGFVPGPGTL
ncbi:hypothetical protein ACLESD_32935, partial [Pyxidicoccus sp. 3LFB2]